MNRDWRGCGRATLRSRLESAIGFGIQRSWRLCGHRQRCSTRTRGGPSMKRANGWRRSMRRQSPSARCLDAGAARGEVDRVGGGDARGAGQSRDLQATATGRVRPMARPPLSRLSRHGVRTAILGRVSNLRRAVSSSTMSGCASRPGVAIMRQMRNSRSGHHSGVGAVALVAAVACPPLCWRRHRQSLRHRRLDR